MPDDRVADVMQAAIAECRKRTAAHIPLPAGESFSMALVNDKSWGAYNYYKGGNQSLHRDQHGPAGVDRQCAGAGMP